MLVLFFFKLATVILIFWHLRTWESGVILGATFWYWIPPLLLLGAGPVVFYYRLRKVRSPREALRRSEWMVGDDQDAEVRSGAPLTPGTHLGSAAPIMPKVGLEPTRPAERRGTHLGGTAGWVGLRGRSCDPHSYSFWSRRLSRSSLSASANCYCSSTLRWWSTKFRGSPATVQEFVRPELLMALGLSLVVLFGGAVLSGPDASRGHSMSRSLSASVPSSPRHTTTDRRGVDQARPARNLGGHRTGFTLYARNGALAKVIALLPAEDEYGKSRRGIVYASGLYGANDEMWIPLEAVYAVYPETGSAFLAAKGDEIEHFGWNLPPESFRRGQSVHAPLPSF